jgi:hypothetical protein
MTAQLPLGATPSDSEPASEVAQEGWWLASDGRWYPPAGHAFAGPQPARKRRIPVWVWVLGAVAALGALAVGVLFLLGLNAALTHELLDERFDSGGGVFETGTYGDTDYQVRDGTYVITSLTDSANSGFSYGKLARTAYAVHATVDVVSVTNGGADPVFAGVGCTTADGQEGYMLSADSSGKAAMILRIEGDKVRQAPLASDETLNVGPLRQLRLDCAVANPLGNSVNITAYINGVKVLTAYEGQGASQYESMMLLMAASKNGAEVRFDNAKANVPD